MARREIDPEKKKEAQSFTMKMVLAMTVVLVLYVAYSLITKNLNLVVFEILLGIFIVGYTLLSDVVEPYKLGIFEEMTEGQKGALVKLLLFDAVGVGALLYYIVGMNTDVDQANGMLFPIVIYLLCMQMKRKLRPELEGVTEEEEQEEAAEAEQEAEEQEEEKQE